ncbi:MAG: hypothetical protein HC871_07515, partial [Rhizobiales bacterium]|nr:hypothetical protein [Hyphomicrobiales bacterium]
MRKRSKHAPRRHKRLYAVRLPRKLKGEKPGQIVQVDTVHIGLVPGKTIRHFTGYCAEVLVSIQPDKLYKFKVGSVHAPENYGVQDHPNADRVAARRAKQIQELFETLRRMQEIQVAVEMRFVTMSHEFFQKL